MKFRSNTPIKLRGKNGKGKQQMAKIYISLDIVGPGILALLCWRFPLAEKEEKGFGFQTNGVLTYKFY